MTQEDKELLLKDLCGRLPYDVAINCKNDDSNYICYLTTDIINELKYNREYYEYKPYLFPLSSMTLEQKKELCKVGGYETREEDCGYHSETFYYNMVGRENVFYPDADDIDWLNKNHFDYRGLIEKGLALKAPDGMYN